MDDRDQAADGALIRSYLGGDERAFEELYSRYRRRLYSYLNGLLPGQSALVDDLYSQTWTRILEHLPRYHERQRFLSWAFRIAHNLAMDQFRRQAQVVEVELDEQLPAGSRSPGEAMDREAFDAALDRAIRQLSPEQREVVLLRQAGVPFREIAQIQDTGINTVLGRMHYAVGRLQLLLADYL
jgi:RNA polymerase sigma-70 factor (ECF subfamily)